MTDTDLKHKEVFEFSSNDNDFRPSAQFVRDLTASRFPCLIMFIGNTRAGKSTRTNQIIQHELRPDGPFISDSGVTAITKRFQSLHDHLFAIHDVPLPVHSNPDLFLIDCEGLHSLGHTTPVLKQATFALSQIVTMTVLVMKDLVNHENIDSVRSLFVLSHAFSRHLPGFSIGTTIMMREIGIRRENGESLSVERKNARRREADQGQRELVLKFLNQAELNFSEQDLLVLAQPSFDDPELYWKSMEDFFHFTAAIADGKSRISGQSLLQLFEEAKQSITKVTDFSNPRIPFQQILQNLTVRYLKEAGAIVIKSGEKEVKEWITKLDSVSLRRGLDVGFGGNLIRNGSWR
jgi:hypothetical protein